MGRGLLLLIIAAALAGVTSFALGDDDDLTTPLGGPKPRISERCKVDPTACPIFLERPTRLLRHLAPMRKTIPDFEMFERLGEKSTRRLKRLLF